MSTDSIRKPPPFASVPAWAARTFRKVNSARPSDLRRDSWTGPGRNQNCAGSAWSAKTWMPSMVQDCELSKSMGASSYGAGMDRCAASERAQSVRLVMPFLNRNFARQV
jgi:hypothetical protein